MNVKVALIRGKIGYGKAFPDTPLRRAAHYELPKPYDINRRNLLGHIVA